MRLPLPMKMDAIKGATAHPVKELRKRHKKIVNRKNLTVNFKLKV
jgi:hypothetical protein